MVAREFLDSDRVNFLIWRYLLEGNYRETAAKFQKEWHHKEPHREFAFARHVKGHALVSVINRGLIYYALEREYAQSRNQTLGAATEAETLQAGVFGPLDFHPPAKIEEDEDPQPEDVEVSRKRAQDHQHQMNGSPAKRPRLSNGYDTGADAVTVTTPMDVDDQHDAPNHTSRDSHDNHETHDNHSNHDTHDNHAYPSPLEGEQVPPPIVRTDGPEQGTQVEKVEELSPNTTFIRLMDDARGTETAPPSPSTAGAESTPILLQCEWNPKDASILAAAGTDALARVWTVSQSTAPEAGNDHVSPPALTLIDPETPRSTTVSALSWTSDGNAIAVAMDNGQGSHATINVWSADGALLQGMDVAEGPILKLSWNPSNTALLAISPEKGGAMVTVHYSPASRFVSYSLPNYDMGTPPDAAWTNDGEFLLTAGDTLISLHCTESAIVPAPRKFDTKEDDSFSQVLFDWRSELAATSSDKGTLDLWDKSGQRKSISAHQGSITTMAWQPLQSNQLNTDERLIATGGEDCAILIWNARLPESFKPKCFLTMDSPIVRLAFTPDGAFIAGATANQVLIWKVGHTNTPRASWSRPTHEGWASPRANSETEEEDEHCLCWDASGQKLAYGSNSRLAVINFRR